MVGKIPKKILESQIREEDSNDNIEIQVYNIMEIHFLLFIMQINSINIWD